jgi:sugar phosphate isomerase/epimerase
MKLAISTYSLSSWSGGLKTRTLEEVIAKIAEFDVVGVEFCDFFGDAHNNPFHKIDLVNKRVAKTGLLPAGYATGWEFLVPLEEQKRRVDFIKRQIDVASALGCKTMRYDLTGGWGPHAKDVPGPRTFANALKHLVPVVREIADYGQVKKVVTSIENHGWYMQNSKRIEKLILAVGHKNYRLTMDMGNFLCVNDNPTKAAQLLAKYACMVHTKDFHVKKKGTQPPNGWFETASDLALRGAIVGHGVLEIPKQLAALKKANYKGFLSLEFEGIEDPIFAINSGLAYLRRELKALKAIE